MIEFIKPPTDNLYKFAAIFGLVLIVVGFTFPPWLFYQSSLQYLKSLAGDDELAAHKKFAEVRNRVLKERRETVAAERAKLQQRLDNLAKSQGTASVSAEIDKLESAIKEARKEAETLEDTSHEFNLNLELKAAEAKQQQTFSTNETRNSRLVMVVGWIIGFIGLFFACMGFIMWYKRVAVFQDKILKMQATSTITASAAAASERGHANKTSEGAE